MKERIMWTTLVNFVVVGICNRFKVKVSYIHKISKNQPKIEKIYQWTVKSYRCGNQLDCI